MDRKRGTEGTGASGGPEGRPGARRSRWLWWIVLGSLFLLLFVNPFGSSTPVVPYSTFTSQLAAGNVTEVAWKGDRIQGRFAHGVTLPARGAAPTGNSPAANGAAGNGSAAGGSNAGGSNAGGSNASGSNANGSNANGSATNGSTAGGSNANRPNASGPAANTTGPGSSAGASQGNGSERTVTVFRTYVPSSGDPQLVAQLERHGVVVHTRPQGNDIWLPLLLGGLPIVLLLLFGAMFLRRVAGQGGAGSQLFSVGRSKAKLYHKEDASVTFGDVAGADGAKRELEETIDFLKSPAHFLKLGGRTPSGILLVGPPGTGKTLLARAVAGEAEVPFFSTSGSDFMEMFVGVGASRVRDMFKDAKESAPAIIFIDELDSVGRRRGAGIGGGNDEREQTLNQLLNEMDGFEPHASVVVMAATNRPDVLDPALLRPGRFDKRITVGLPTRAAREQILRIHARGKPLADDVDLDRLARGTPGMAGADLENLLNEAALHAARDHKSQIEAVDIEAARDEALLGRTREGLSVSEDDRRAIAYHEAGHAVVASLLPDADPVSKVSIIPRGQAMGGTHQLPEHEMVIYRREYLLDRIAVMMGGRAAELKILGTATSGAAADLRQASQLARRMVKEFGMSDALGPVSFEQRDGQVFLGEELAQTRDYSEATEREIDQEVRRLLDGALGVAVGLIERHRGALERLVERLMRDEEVDGAVVEELVAASPASGEGVTALPRQTAPT